MSVSMTGEQMQKHPGQLRAEARRSPVVVTYHGRPELVVMSVEDYETLRMGRKQAARIDELPPESLARIAENRMDERHSALDALLDD